jgi:HEAT repeat protein
MDEGYWPSSSFLCMIANDEIPLAGSAAGERNLKLLMDLTQDQDVSNRDWATMLLSQQDIDTPEVRQTLLRAAEDSNGDVRAEALEGLAMRNKQLARPLVERELRRNDCGYGTFEAARLIADPALVPALQDWAGRFERSTWNDLVSEAIAACEAAH